MALYNPGRATWRMGRWDEALDHLEQASAFSRRQDDVAMLVQEFCVIAGIALEKETLDVALRTLDEVNAMLSRVSDKRVQWRLVERAAGYACRQGALGKHCALPLRRVGETQRMILSTLRSANSERGRRPRSKRSARKPEWKRMGGSGWERTCYFSKLWCLLAPRLPSAYRTRRADGETCGAQKLRVET